MWLSKRFKLFKEKTGVIAPVPVWVLIDFEYGFMYMHENLFHMLLICATQWRLDKHIIG